MESRSYLKLFLDILIALIFVLLFNDRVLGGLPFHEVAGLGIGLGFLVHLAINLQWVKNVTLRLFDRRLPAKTRFGYFLNVVLLISMFIIILSGVMISRIVFPDFRSANQHWFQELHLGISYLALVLVGIHVGLHGQWLISILKRLFQVKSSKMTVILARICIVLLIIFGGSQVIATQVASRVTQLGTGVSINSQKSNHGAGFGEERGGHRGDLGEERIKGGTSSVNPAGVILSYSGVIGVFAIITYYGEKALTRRRS